MAVIQLGVDIPGAPAESNDEMKEFRRRSAENEKRLEAHQESIEKLRKSQEEQQTTINRFSEILKEMQPTVQSLKSLATLLRQIPNFSTHSSAKTQRMAG